MAGCEIENILRRYPIDWPSAGVEPLGMAGGLSGAHFWRVSLPGRELVLRRWPSEHPTPDRLRFIHAVLQHATRRGFNCLPVPLLTNDGPSFVEHDGHFWELAPWMPGVADFDQNSNEKRLQAALRTLAQFHVAVADFDATRFNLPQPAPPIRRRIARLSQPHPDVAAGLARVVTDSIWPELAPLAREFVSALPQAALHAAALLEPVSRSSLPLQVCIRDIWHDHVLFTADEVTGLIDFGAVDVDTPAGDVARLLGSLARDDLDRWQRGIEAYATVRPLSPSERSALPGLDASATVIALSNWVRWIYIEKRQFHNRGQVVTRFKALLNRLPPL
jgi:homoserine kinase type II